MSLLPVTVEEYVGKDDPVRYIDAISDEFDLSLIESKYSSFGRPGYNPRVLVKILLYGKMRGLRSSRELERATRENLHFIYLCQNEKPDARTISRFRKNFHQELSQLLRQTVEIGLREQIISLEHVSIDGTKIRAFAGRDSFRSPEELTKELNKLEAELFESFANDIQDDEEDNDEPGGSGKLPGELRDKKALRNRIRKALRHYESIEGEKPKVLSITDPEARYMKSHSSRLPSYNAQIAVDTKSTLVVAGRVSNAGSDHGQLRPMLAEIEKNTGSNPQVVSTDKGYGEIEGLVELKRRKIDGYVPQRAEATTRFTVSDFKYQQKTDAYVCPHGKKLTFSQQSGTHRHYASKSCLGCVVREKCIRGKAPFKTLTVSVHQALVREMNDKIKDARAKAVARIRASTAEPIFGIIKYSKKLRQFFFRSMSMLNSMWLLELAALNLQKLAGFKRIQPA